jgi:hypothetical protein
MSFDFPFVRLFGVRKLETIVSAVPKFIAKAVDVNPWSKQSGMLLTISGLGSTEDHNRRAKQSLLWKQRNNRI